MKNNEYLSPKVDIVEVIVEAGICSSFGETGEAGGGVDTDDSGSF